MSTFFLFSLRHKQSTLKIIAKTQNKKCQAGKPAGQRRWHLVYKATSTRRQSVPVHGARVDYFSSKHDTHSLRLIFYIYLLKGMIFLVGLLPAQRCDHSRRSRNYTEPQTECFSCQRHKILQCKGLTLCPAVSVMIRHKAAIRNITPSTHISKPRSAEAVAETLPYACVN